MIAEIHLAIKRRKVLEIASIWQVHLAMLRLLATHNANVLASISASRYRQTIELCGTLPFEESIVNVTLLKPRSQTSESFIARDYS
ncbi:MAG: hypothetical protein ACI9G1_002552, partial [Pirellulaceae bacterium]